MKNRIVFQPPFSTVRFTGMVVVAYLFSTVVSLAIPEDNVGGLSWQWLHVFTPLAAALGKFILKTLYEQKQRTNKETATVVVSVTRRSIQ